MSPESSARWVVLTWRLPSGSSTLRVNLWRSLRRLGAAVLTPGTAILPCRDDLHELGWLAQEVETQDGDAWVLPVLELSEREERRVREQMRTDRRADYEELHAEARDFLRRAPDHPDMDGDFALRLRAREGAAGAAAAVSQNPRARLLRCARPHGDRPDDPPLPRIQAGYQRETQPDHRRSPGLRKAAMHFITRERIHVDRIATAWAIRRFVDAEADNRSGAGFAVSR